MYGTFIGNFTAIIYFLCYQLCGVLISDYLFNKEKKIIRLLIGSVLGSFLLMWLPTLTSMVMDFNITSHIIALIILLAILICVVYFVQKKSDEHIQLLIYDISFKGDAGLLTAAKNNIVFIVSFIILTVFFGLLLDNHVLVVMEDGIYCGQCTYGDMNMHLGFITSIAKQGTFPPDYSIMPGQKLGYPFLCDSVSSSLYIFGPSLKLAYCLPMIVAFMQTLGGFYAFAYKWLKERAKSIVAFLLFFLNGGLGFLYFINVIGDKTHSISEIFTEFYHTPTNFVDYNVRWVNVIADMLLPQRATLFGWSILFTVLYILWRAHFEGKKKYFYAAGILAGGMVMIHTHSFLALGIVCAVWLFYHLVDLNNKKFGFNKKLSMVLRSIFILVSLAIMSLLRIYDLRNSNSEDLKQLWFIIGIVGVAVYVLCVAAMIFKLVYDKNIKPVLTSWGVFLAVVLPLALSQLFTWTFKQATGDHFVRGQFNWANINDQYITFYVKNIGLVMLFIIVALIISKKKYFRLAVSGLAIWFIAEFLGFQPNEYDNNKLLFVGFLFLLIPAASVMVDLYKQIKPRLIAILLAAVVMFVCTISGILTLGREYVSEYQLYSNEYMGIVDYINSSDIPADAVILTNNNHNNAVASLTGRNIVVGTATFLYYHGFDTTEREYEVTQMFQNPAENLDLFEKYGIEYIVIGSYEYYSYDIDYDWFNANAYELYSGNGATLLKLR